MFFNSAESFILSISMKRPTVAPGEGYGVSFVDPDQLKANQNYKSISWSMKSWIRKFSALFGSEFICVRLKYRKHSGGKSLVAL